MNYFTTIYDEVGAYSRNWYGTRDFAPNATIILYDDNERFCIGYMEADLPEDLIPITEQHAMTAVEEYEDGEGVYFGEKLDKRWEVEQDG